MNMADVLRAAQAIGKVDLHPEKEKAMLKRVLERLEKRMSQPHDAKYHLPIPHHHMVHAHKTIRTRIAELEEK